jgi:hypothetical protein
LRRAASFEREITFSWEDTLICLGFAGLPAFGVILGQIAHTPYYGRYFLSAVLGFCIPFGVIAGAIHSGRHLRLILLPVIAAALLLNFSRLLRHQLTGSGETLQEPSSGKQLSTTVGKPLLFHPLIQNQAKKGSEPIAILDPLDFLYLLHYAPALAPRLYYVHPSSHDMFLRGFEMFRPWSPVKYNPALTGAELTAHFKTFYLYSHTFYVEDFGRMCRLATVQAFWGSGEQFLANMQTK